MKIITLEEHYLDPAVAAAGPAPAGAGGGPSGGMYAPSPQQLQDLDEGRLADMDRNHIDMQVLSSLTTQLLSPDVAVEAVRGTNDMLAAAVKRHPDRFAGFAALPTSVPDAAAVELERCVTQLGFVGTLIMGRTQGEFLSAARFDPILAKAAELRVPIYLHPGVPPADVVRENYSGLAPQVTAGFSTFAWGWHTETAVHFIHLVLSGALDRYPDLQIILGHWGELIPFYLERIDEALPTSTTKLDRSFGEYLRQNVYVTPSGLFTQANLQYCIELLGADRIMYSVDYPFVGNERAQSFLLEAKVSEQVRESIAHGTAERVLGLDVAAS